MHYILVRRLDLIPEQVDVCCWMSWHRMVRENLKDRSEKVRVAPKMQTMHHIWDKAVDGDIWKFEHFVSIWECSWPVPLGPLG